MNNLKTEILKKICYTELVYERINKKLNKQLSKSEIEELILTIINETIETEFEKTGKNIYVTNKEKQVRLTINSNNYRIITADRLHKK
jgi:ribosomal protein S3AE